MCLLISAQLTFSTLKDPFKKVFFFFFSYVHIHACVCECRWPEGSERSYPLVLDLRCLMWMQTLQKEWVF